MVIATSNTASQLVPQNKLRKSITIMNVDATDTVYLKREQPGRTTVTSTDFDIRLSPGAAYSLNSMLDGAEAIHDRYTVIASANTPSVSVFETEEARR
jgi:hypothetical protein